MVTPIIQNAKQTQIWATSSIVYILKEGLVLIIESKVKFKHSKHFDILKAIEVGDFMAFIHLIP